MLIWCSKNINFLLLTFVLHKFVETVKPFFSVFGEYKVQTNSTWKDFLETIYKFNCHSWIKAYGSKKKYFIFREVKDNILLKYLQFSLRTASVKRNHSTRS